MLTTVSVPVIERSNYFEVWLGLKLSQQTHGVRELKQELYP